MSTNGGVVKISRRDFVRLSSVAYAGLVLGVPHLGAKSKQASTHDLGTFVQIDTAGIVTVWIPKSEMGQGVRTSLAMIVAEELDADWNRVRVRQAHFDRKFGNQGTGGSGSIRTSWMPLRQAGAAARAMLVSAAAAKLGADPASLSVREGVIAHSASGRTVPFGAVAEQAAKLEVPKELKLKDPSEFRIIGKSLPRVDLRDIVTGNAKYGIDVKVPGMLYAAVRRATVFGARVASFDASKAKALPGVRHVVQVDAIGPDMPWSGVAVVADSTWAALRGRDALEVKWNEGAGSSESSDALRVRMNAALEQKSKTVYSTGEVAVAAESELHTVEATYEVPYLAHATMEPMNATAHVTADGAELWVPTQAPERVNSTVAAALKLKPEQVKVNITLMGGGFGRRLTADYAIEAAIIARAVGLPVKVQWTREDDMQHDYYRPAAIHRVTGTIDSAGNIVSWHHRMSSPSRRLFTDANHNAPHESEVGGLAEMPWLIPNVRIDYAPENSVVPRGAWRSVAYSGNGFAFCSFVDELAHAAGKDVVDVYLALAGSNRVKQNTNAAAKDYPFSSDRFRRVVELARDKSGWSASSNGRARGFAACYSFLTYVAQVAEVSMRDGDYSVDRVVCAVDCGTVVNPDGVVAQIEGAVLDGLATLRAAAITIRNGAVEQSNFNDYPLIRINEVPKIEVYIVPSTALPTGMGEPGYPPLAAAVAGAIFRATGKRMRTLPFQLA